MICTKDEFIEWATHPVTKALVEHLNKTIDDSKDILASEAGSNPIADRELVGGISAMKDILEWKPDIYENSESEGREGTS